MITSISNAKVKHVRSLARRRARYQAQQFVVEGVRLMEEAVGAGINPALVFYTAQAEEDPRSHILLDKLRVESPQVLQVDDSVIHAISSTETSQGILAVVPFIKLPLPTQPQFILILDAVRDPGNVGTILRSARAAGVDEILFAPGTADMYNDKVVRAGMGAHFHIPLRFASRWEDIATTVKGIPRIYLADARGEVIFTRADWSRPVALIVGGEAAGASGAAIKITTARVSIPMQGGAESLNVAMAATVLLFQATHQ